MKYSPPRFLFRRYEILKNAPKGKKFLEIGAGNLELSKDLLNNFEKGFAVDFEEKVKEYYSRLNDNQKSKLDIKIGDFFKMDLDKNSFDCVVSCEVLEHVNEEDRFVSRIFELLNSKGKVLISVPARMKYWSRHDEIVGHVKRYEKNELKELFERNGFKNVKVISYGLPFINIFRIFRILLATAQFKKKSQWSQEKQTKESGVGQIPKSFKLLGIVCNKYVFYPLNLIATLFNDIDISDGYILVGEK